MRWLLLLLLLPCIARADGFAYGKSMRMVRETDQIAVIHLDERQADVNMFIAIDGIPAGETVTYVLPFWYRPDGFTLTEMASNKFQQQVTRKAHEKLVGTNRIASSRSSERLLRDSVGLLLPPLVLPYIGMGSSEKARQIVTASIGYDLALETEHARVELYRGVRATDLPALVARAGLPAQDAASLKKYHTQHFAVMRLTGPKAGEKAGGTGVRYHFRHAIPADQRGTYTYPLGTGAAWAKPILLTEVYITCPDKYALQVTAPTLGQKARYGEFSPLYYEARFQAAESPSHQSDLHATYTASKLYQDAHAPSAWHIAYLNSNPSEDIAVKLYPRPHAVRYAVVRFLSHGSWGYAIHLAFPLLAIAMGWWASARFIIRPRWEKRGKPGSLVGQVAYTAVVPYIGPNLLFFTIVAFPISILCVLVGILFVSWIKPVKHSLARLRFIDILAGWAGAIAVYAVLVGGAYLFLCWCEAAI